METNLKEKYGLLTAIAMVVGIVIGSGVFFKAEKVLNATGGNLPIGILAWILGGCIMIICAYTFAILATRYNNMGGMVDYAEALLGSRYGYYMGWFCSVIYFPAMTSVLAWVSARYTCVLLGFDITGGECMTISCFFLVAAFALNTLSPILAGKFQVSTTVIKLIPLFLMAIVGTVSGLSNGMTVRNFTTVVDPSVDPMNALFTAVVATSFAYEGWIIATSINAEIKDAKKNLPRALVGGTFIIMATYLLYYIGLAGAVENEVLMASGESGAKMAFTNVFSSLGGTLIFVFVIISCLGTLNGLMLGCTRGLYAIAMRDKGPKPVIFKQVDKVTNIPTNSAVLAVMICAAWLLYFYGANLTAPWFGFFCFDSSELPIVTVYGLYIPIFIMMMKKEKDLSGFKRFVMPALSIVSCIFMIIAACVSHGMGVVAYLIVFFVLMGVGALLERTKSETL